MTTEGTTSVRIVYPQKEFTASSSAHLCGSVTAFQMANRGRQGLVTSMPDDNSVRSVSSEDMSYVGVRGQCCVKASNPAYKRGRRLQLLQMLVLPFIPILALIVQTAIALRDILTYRQEVSDIEAQVCCRYDHVLTVVTFTAITLVLISL